MALLNWNSGEHYDSKVKSCTQCGGGTPLRSHTGEAVHKVCAETWNENNPTAPRFEHEGRDLGTTQFHSDLPRQSRKEGAQ